MDNFKLSTNVYFGANSLDILDEIENEKVILVCDAFMVSSGMADKVKSHLKSCEVTVFDKVVPDPAIEIISQGIKCLESCQATIMIALGGGSSIDAAKAIRNLADKLNMASIHRCYAIPTTSGTGSEVTRFSVITNAAEGVKYPLIDDALQPMVAILDPELVESVPKPITADTGMDALTHALEAYVANDANDFTDALAEKAVTLIMKFLPEAYAHGNNLLAREKVHNASCLAGMSFNLVGVGLCHSIAHTVGAKFHVPHGRANAMLLLHIIKYNADLGSSAETLAARKYQRMAKLIGLPYSNVNVAVNSLVKRIEEMNSSFGIPSRLTQMDIHAADIKAVKDHMVHDALADACTATNPRKPSAEDVEKIIRGII